MDYLFGYAFCFSLWQLPSPSAAQAEGVGEAGGNGRAERHGDWPFHWDPSLPGVHCLLELRAQGTHKALKRVHPNPREHGSPNYQ